MKLLATATAMALAMSVTAASADWKLYKKADEFTDKEFVYAMLNLQNRGLMVRCKDDELMAAYGIEAKVANPTMTVRYRIDKEPLVQQSWSAGIIEGATVVTFAIANNGKEFALQLMKGAKLLIEA